MSMNTRLGIAATSLALGWLSAGPSLCQSQIATPTLAVGALAYVDTSGEPRDQVADHVRRVKVFADSLRADLASGGKFRITALDCPDSQCSAGTVDPAALVAKAKEAGATYLLIGGVHKESTLIQWAKFDILDVATTNVVFDRLLTFRGDNDAAWRRAERFLGREILQQDIARKPR